MAEQPETHIQITQYEVSVLPEDDINHSLYALTVEHRGGDRWAVCRYGQCLDAKGVWNHEPRPSSRTDAWKRRFRHDRDTAIRLATEAARTITVNGVSVADVLARSVKKASA